jgi:hypothetical protein
MSIFLQIYSTNDFFRRDSQKLADQYNATQKNLLMLTTCLVWAWGGVAVKATSRKVPGSIPGGVTGDFFVESDNSMCPGSTQPLKMSTRILLG